jgi:hypothetical protein
MAYNFQIGIKSIKLLTEYQSVTQKALLLIESILYNAKQLQHVQFYFVVSGYKIIGHGNPDNNLESLCICLHFMFQWMQLCSVCVSYIASVLI